MKKTALALIVICLTSVGQSYAACKTEACRQAVVWKAGYTAIVLNDDITPADYLGVLAAVTANQGVVAIEAERVLLGWVPVASSGKVRAARGVRAVLRDMAAQPEVLVRNPQALSALSFFNRVVSGEYEDMIESGLPATGQPLTGCVVGRWRDGAFPEPTDLAATSGIEVNHAEAEVNAGTAEEHTGGPRRPQARISPNFGFRTPYQNPDMRGRVSVQIFRLDSDGTLDPNLYTWTSTDMGSARDQVYGAFNFWAHHAAARGIPLSFKVNIVDPFSRYTRTFTATKTRYEPVMRPPTDDYKWVNDALAPHGYGASPVTAENVYLQNEAFNRAYKTDVYGNTYDRSFSVYIAYNPAGAPNTFGNSKVYAYAMTDGPFVMQLWRSGGYGPANLGKVLTHETAHIFWACDEYYEPQSGNGCQTCQGCFYNVGPRNIVSTPWVTNKNCNNPEADGVCDVGTNCIMKDIGHNALCPHTPGQVGW